MLMARALWLVGMVLAAAGFVLALSPAALLVWAGEVRYAALAAALAGVTLGSLGVFIVRRQAARIAAEKRRAEDRLRRVHLYRDNARREPFIARDTDARDRRIA
jgi:hypothetical protein